MNPIYRLLGFASASLLITLGAWAHDPSRPSGHLEFRDGTLHIHAIFPAEPVTGSESPLILEARAAATHQWVDLRDEIQVELWMPSMGHGSASTQVERALGPDGEVLPGVFNVRNVQFVMPGEWEVRITLIDIDGRTEMKSFRVLLSGRHDHGG